MTFEQQVLVDYIIKKNNYYAPGWRRYPDDPYIAISDDLPMLRSMHRILGIGHIEVKPQEFLGKDYSNDQFKTSHELKITTRDGSVWFCKAILDRFNWNTDSHGAESFVTDTLEAAETYLESRKHGRRYELPYQRRKRMGLQRT